MIIQSKDADGDLNVLGIGTVCTRKDADGVVKYMQAGKTAKGMITITVKVRRELVENVMDDRAEVKPKFNYTNVPCAVYGRQGNKEIFAVLEELKAKDRVVFAGVYYKRKATDSVSGQELDFSEVRLDFLLPYDKLMFLVLGDDTRVREMKSEKQVENAVKSATNRKERKKKYKF